MAKKTLDKVTEKWLRRSLMLYCAKNGESPRKDSDDTNCTPGSEDDAKWLAELNEVQFCQMLLTWANEGLANRAPGHGVERPMDQFSVSWFRKRVLEGEIQWGWPNRRPAERTWFCVCP